MRKNAIAALLACSLASCHQSDEAVQQGTPLSTTADTATTAAVAPCRTTAPAFAPSTQPMTDSTLQRYLQQLQQAVEQQDTRQLTALLDPHVATGFDASGGIGTFEERWKPAAKDSKLWPLLRRLLVLGGAYMPNSKNQAFALPYVYSAWPDSLDAFTHQAVVNDKAILRAAPDSSAGAICVPGRVILQTDYSQSFPQQDSVREKTWWHVQSPDGQKQGYLHRRDLYSPVGYRAILQQDEQGQWRMTALLTGD